VHRSPSYSTRKLLRGLALIGLGLGLPFLVGCVSTGPVQGETVADARDSQDLYIVDCLLPGQVRRLGGATYLSPRRPIRTTTVDCQIRGGEYAAYDRADYRAALNVWLERAQAGEPEAQTYVGEIFEKGLGVEPDYASAAAWYRRAADQGHGRAQINLGYLYEQGLGVERDTAIALNWYRRASGLGEDELVLRSEFAGEIDALQEQLTRQIEDNNRTVAALRNQLERLRSERDRLQRDLQTTQPTGSDTPDPSSEVQQALNNAERRAADTQRAAAEAEREAEELRLSMASAAQESVAVRQRMAEVEQQAAEARRRAAEAERAAQLARQALEAERQAARTREATLDHAAEARAAELATNLANARAEIEVLEGLFQRTDREREQLQTQLAQLPQHRSASVPELQPVMLPDQDPATFDGISFGRYYALIIGNRDYLHIDPLVSPINDAERVRQILQERYGFRTIFLPNADKQQILSALNDLYQQIQPEDNLLVYYAGHGNLSERDQGRRQQGYWLPVDAEQDRLAHWLNNAVISDHLDRIRARSILVLADSCYAGTLASDSSALLLGSIQAALTPDTIQNGLSRRSRVVISSGGVRPVLDTLDGQHSLFANALIDALQNNEHVLRENMLFARVAVNVRRRSQDIAEPQTPEMRPIRAAGHEGGDFYFVPVAAR